MTYVSQIIAVGTPGAQTADISSGRLIVSAIAGILVLIGLITWLKIHPFISLFLSGLIIGIGAGFGPVQTAGSFATGFGNTMASVGILIGFGAMFGKLLADSGGADQIVDTLISHTGVRGLPWMMALIGAIIGLPMFFEVGVVLLVPVVIMVARRTDIRLMKVAVPTLAGLSVMHGLVPPHPGPLAAIAAFPQANLGLTLMLGVAVAIPTVIISGPVLSKAVATWVPVSAPAPLNGEVSTSRERRPSFVVAVTCILIPVILMLARSIYEIVWPPAKEGQSSIGQVIDFLGTPSIALGLSVIVAMIALGRAGGMTRGEVNASVSASLPPIAGILLIVGAGGGLKGVLVDTGIGDVIAGFVENSSIPIVILAWLIAALIRVATGSATVATITTAGILAPVVATESTTMVSLIVLAIGAGSLFLSHVNDAGFWLIKEYFGLTIGQTFKSWTVLECTISLVALACITPISLLI